MCWDDCFWALVSSACSSGYLRSSWLDWDLIGEHWHPSCLQVHTFQALKMTPIDLHLHVPIAFWAVLSPAFWLHWPLVPFNHSEADRSAPIFASYSVCRTKPWCISHLSCWRCLQRRGQPLLRAFISSSYSSAPEFVDSDWLTWSGTRCSCLSSLYQNWYAVVEIRLSQPGWGWTYEAVTWRGRACHK